MKLSELRGPICAEIGHFAKTIVEEEQNILFKCLSLVWKTYLPINTHLISDVAQLNRKRKSLKVKLLRYIAKKVFMFLWGCPLLPGFCTKQDVVVKNQ